MRVLITGATGFAGRHLCSHCLGLGHEVHALVRPGREDAAPPGVTAHPAELGDTASVAAVLGAAAPERLFHLAGAASVGRSFAEPRETWDVNLGGTLAVLEALRTDAPEVPALVVTSGEVYGAVPLDALPVDAGTPLNPVSPYGASKAAADLATAQYRAAYGLPAFRVRAFNQIGPGQDAASCCRTWPGRSRAPSATACPRSRCAWGTWTPAGTSPMCATWSAPTGSSWSAGIPTPSTSPAAAPPRRCARSSRASPPIARIPVTFTSDAGLRREGEQPDLYGSPERLRADTGWTPETPIDTTLADTLAWWRERVSQEED